MLTRPGEQAQSLWLVRTILIVPTTRTRSEQDDLWGPRANVWYQVVSLTLRWPVRSLRSLASLSIVSAAAVAPGVVRAEPPPALPPVATTAPAQPPSPGASTAETVAPPHPVAIGAPVQRDEEIIDRTTFLQAELGAGERSATTWSWAWVGIYGALTAGNFTIAALTDSRDNRVDFIARGSLSTIGLVTSIALWPAAASATQGPSALPANTPDERETKLRAYERSLAKVVKGDSFGTSWKAHAIGFGVNGLAGALVAFGDGRPKQGALVFLGGFAVAEIRIFTRPTRSLRTRDAYEKRAPLAPATVAFVPTAAGAHLIGTF